MFKFERQVGRLFGVLLVAPLTMMEFEDFRTACRMGFLALPGSGVVLTDATQLSLLADDVAEQMLDLDQAAIIQRSSAAHTWCPAG